MEGILICSYFWLINYEKMLCFVSSLLEVKLLPKWINMEAHGFKINQSIFILVTIESSKVEAPFCLLTSKVILLSSFSHDTIAIYLVTPVLAEVYLIPVFTTWHVPKENSEASFPQLICLLWNFLVEMSSAQTFFSVLIGLFVLLLLKCIFM